MYQAARVFLFLDFCNLRPWIPLEEDKPFFCWEITFSIDFSGDSTPVVGSVFLSIEIKTETDHNEGKSNYIKQIDVKYFRCVPIIFNSNSEAFPVSISFPEKHIFENLCSTSFQYHAVYWKLALVNLKACNHTFINMFGWMKVKITQRK